MDKGSLTIEIDEDRMNELDYQIKFLILFPFFRKFSKVQVLRSQSSIKSKNINEIIEYNIEKCLKMLRKSIKVYNQPKFRY